MTREEAVKMLQATRLMLMDGANQPISDLFYALDMAIEALNEADTPQTDCKDTSCPYFKNPDYSRCMKCKPQTDCGWK